MLPLYPALMGLSEIWAALEAWVEGFAASPAASVALGVIAFAESSFFPIPPDVLLIAILLTERTLGSLALTLWFAAVCTAASAAGGAFGYLLGAKAGRPILRRMVKPERISAAEDMLNRHGLWAIGAAGFTPIPYKLITITSGLLRMNFGRFMVVSVLSRGARFFLVALLCYAIGAGVRTFIDQYLGLLTLGFFVALLAGFYGVAVLAKRWRRAETPE